MTATELCVTVTGASMAELLDRRDRVSGADLVELRLDGVAGLDVARALAGRRLPVIATCRPVWEGGCFQGSEAERRAVLEQALAAGAEYVDVEFRASFWRELVAAGGPRVVISRHDFDGVPADLRDLVREMARTGAGVVKVAVMAHRLGDVLALRGLADQAPRLVAIAMGEAGLLSRVLASRFGSAWTYAGDAVAPGQRPAPEYRALGFGRVSDGTSIYGVVGRPVAHSLSPAMHNAAFVAAGLDAVYLPLAAADFADFLEVAGALGLAGASVTAPFKLDAFAAAAPDDDDSRLTGSANTLRRDGGRWLARNTDVAGFLAPLDLAGAVDGRRATVLGAGGAARAAIRGLRARGAAVRVSARRNEAGARLAEEMGVGTAPWPPAGEWDLLVNATPVGTWPDVERSPVPGLAFSGRLAYDLVYNPVETRFLRDARAAGLTTIDGLEMLVAQAREQFEWWTGRPAPARVMRDAALAALAFQASRAAGAPGHAHAVTD
ncbi:MAG: type I 3-dehydroquinate dehydratase [Vicinamibacterales bacterium]